jgi:hypothetical protein
MSDPTKNTGAVKVQVGITEEREESLAVFRLIGRSDPVVLSGDTYGDDMNFEVFAATRAEWEALKPVLMHQGTLLLQMPITDASSVAEQKYIRIVKREWARLGTSARQQFAVRLSAVQVGEGYDA